MLGEILQFDDLRRLCRPEGSGRRPTLRTVTAWADSQGIRYLYDGQGGIFTTMRALHVAMGLEKRELGEGERPLYLDI